MPTFHFLVGTFNTPQLYTLEFSLPESHSTTNGRVNDVDRSANGQHSSSSEPSLSILHRSAAIGSHSWLHITPPNRIGSRFLYCTGWTEPPSLVSYEIRSPSDIRQLNCVTTAQRSGYVCANEHAVYSAGAAIGEVFAIDPSTGGFATENNHPSTANGSITQNGSTPNNTPNGNYTTSKPSPPIQTVSFLDPTKPQKQRNDGSTMDFGGIRHGAHSADLSPSGATLYVADIGRNCIWTYSVSPTDGTLSFGTRNPAPRVNDGPRHAWPHPNGQTVYSLQEHTSMVDVFRHTADASSGAGLAFVHGVPVLPADHDPKHYWADEVRLSLSSGATPRYLYASNRGLEPGTRGYVAAYALTASGEIDFAQGRKGLLHMYETATSGGWANAVQPGPTVGGVEYVALTDSEVGRVCVLGFDGRRFSEAAVVRLDEGAGAATAVWL